MDRHVGNSIVDISGETSPHEVIAGLRSRGNILRSYMINGWCVIGHEDVKTLIRDPRVSAEVFESKLLQRGVKASARGNVVPLIDLPSMLNLDAPDHTRLRKLVSRSFTNRFVQSLSPKIESIVTSLLDDIPDHTHFDFMDALAKPLPAIVIAEMLGVPAEERHLFESWSADLVGYTEIFSPDVVYAAVQGDLAMRDYLQKLVDHKRSQPGQDLISALIEAEIEAETEGEALNMDELLSTCTLLLVAGHETTTRLLGNCLTRLLQNPEQLQAVNQDSNLLSGAIEESLRLDPPVLALSRLVRESFEYKGAQFKKGQVLMLSIAGANRDPAVVDDPDQFCVERERFKHISFGHGIHQCLGMPLARLEARIALQQLFERFPNPTIAQEITWESSPFFRGPTQLFLDGTNNPAVVNRAAVS